MTIASDLLTQEINSVLHQLTDDIKNQRLEIPSPPDLILKLRALTADENTTSAEIAELVKHDLNISGRLIKVANSSLFGARVHVTTTQAAITRLGSTKVQNLITGLIIAQNFLTAKVKGLESHFNKAWQQSNHVAAIAFVLAHKKSTLDPEQALLAGMLHNIGILPLIIRISTIPVFKDKPELLTKVADIVIPKLYQSAGKLILDSWNFSQVLSQIPITHTKINCESSGELTLNELIALAYELDKLKDINTPEKIPNKLESTDVFRKIWQNLSTATAELSGLAQEISELKVEMMS
jgi:HD-like signal output (HDOD) protein